MEVHRLKPMKKGYDEDLFNRLYADTKALRRKLTSEIDPKRFGLEYNDIFSWFDVKFIYTFNKYYGEMNEDLLKGHIISALQFFKSRILRGAYSKKNLVNNQCLDIDEVHDHQNIAVEYNYSNDNETLLTLALNFMQENLSPEAYMLLVTEVKPPLYILIKLEDKESTTKIPSKLVEEYLGLDHSKALVLKKEIKTATYQASAYFSNSTLV